MKKFCLYFLSLFSILLASCGGTGSENSSNACIKGSEEPLTTDVLLNNLINNPNQTIDFELSYSCFGDGKNKDLPFYYMEGSYKYTYKKANNSEEAISDGKNYRYIFKKDVLSSLDIAKDNLADCFKRYYISAPDVKEINDKGDAYELIAYKSMTSYHSSYIADLEQFKSYKHRDNYTFSMKYSSNTFIESYLEDFLPLIKSLVQETLSDANRSENKFEYNLNNKEINVPYLSSDYRKITLSKIALEIKNNSPISLEIIGQNKYENDPAIDWKIEGNVYGVGSTTVQFVDIEDQCSHGNRTYKPVNSLYHQLTCDSCGKHLSGKEAHSNDNDFLYCTKCHHAEFRESKEKYYYNNSLIFTLERGMNYEQVLPNIDFIKPMTNAWYYIDSPNIQPAFYAIYLNESNRLAGLLSIKILSPREDQIKKINIIYAEKELETSNNDEQTYEDYLYQEFVKMKNMQHQDVYFSVPELLNSIPQNEYKLNKEIYCFEIPS